MNRKILIRCTAFLLSGTLLTACGLNTSFNFDEGKQQQWGDDEVAPGGPEHVNLQELNQELIEAAKTNDITRVILLLAIDGIDPNTQDENGATPLMWAAHNEHLDVIMVLRRYQGHPKLRRTDNEGVNAAAYTRCPKIVEKLIGPFETGFNLTILENFAESMPTWPELRNHRNFDWKVGGLKGKGNEVYKKCFEIFKVILNAQKSFTDNGTGTQCFGLIKQSPIQDQRLEDCIKEAVSKWLKNDIVCPDSKPGRRGLTTQDNVRELLLEAYGTVYGKKLEKNLQKELRKNKYRQRFKKNPKRNNRRLGPAPSEDEDSEW